MSSKKSGITVLIGRILDSTIIAGIIILVFGAYYAVIKAGIPYQDPPLELQIVYAAREKMATELIFVGIQVIALGALLRGIVWLVEKRGRKHNKKP